MLIGRHASVGLAFVLAASACGGGEREFEAAELINELRDNGAGLQLGEPLPNDQEGLEVYDVSISGAVVSGGDHAESAVTLIVTKDEEGAVAEFERCESAVSLTCFRAANGVLLLSDDDPETLAKIEAAVRALESE